MCVGCPNLLDRVVISFVQDIHEILFEFTDDRKRSAADSCADVMNGYARTVQGRLHYQSRAIMSRSSRRTIARPSPSSFNLPTATSRDSGTIPQLVHGKSLTGSTYFIAARIVDATCSGVSILSVATSMAPTITSLPLSNTSK